MNTPFLKKRNYFSYTIEVLPLAFLLIGVMISTASTAQTTSVNFFKEVVFTIENQTFSTAKDTIRVRGEKHLHFIYENIHAVAEVKVFPSKLHPIRALELLPSKDFEVVDSVVNVNNAYFRFKVKFKQLTLSEYLQFTFSLKTSLFINPYIQELKLLHSSHTSAFLNPKDDKLFIGEERSFKIETNRPYNINFSGQWTRDKNINYKFSREQGELRINLLPTKVGKQVLEVPITLKVPNFELLTNRLLYELPPLSFEFEVQESKLTFLNSNKKDITLQQDNRAEGIEIELKYHPGLGLKKTYRLEEQEAAGGALVAEFFTRNILANGRVLCWLRTYEYHRQSEGYLYIKDGDKAKFVTNFNITPETRIDKITVLSKKGNASRENTLFPGETVEIRIRGEGLPQAQFTFEGLEEIRKDSLLRTENELAFLAKVPLDINKREVEILNYGIPFGKTLKVQEFQVAHPLDFIRLTIEKEKNLVVSEIDQSIFSQQTIPDVVIAFDPQKIDSKERLFGKQFLSIEVVVVDKDNKLLDKQTIPNVVICPDATSPRFDFYETKDCRSTNINLNQYLRQKTFDLEAWSRIEIIIQHDRTKYSGQGFYKKAEIILRRSNSFDLDVSFPAGLITKKSGDTGYGTLSGVSMAIIAQFSFYHPQRIAKTRPFKIGAGFLALNAFNFSENSTNRDVGIVVLGSLYPVPRKTRSKLSFPLYLGGGYFLSESKFFYLLGPGIRLDL